IAREKTLVEAQLQRDLLATQVSSGPSNEGDAKPQDEIINEMTTKLCDRINSIKTYADLSRAQLENDLSNANRELEQMRMRYENAEAARKALSEKYKNALEGYDETLSSPLRRLNLTVTPGRRNTDSMTARKKKERRQTMFTPKSTAGRKSRAFRPVLFDDSAVEDDAKAQGNIEQDEDMVEERELLRLEMDNNRLSQILSEKDSQIEGL
ncbi:unnamed protein product, partial [Strongylus vulgaris]